MQRNSEGGAAPLRRSRSSLNLPKRSSLISCLLALVLMLESGSSWAALARSAIRPGAGSKGQAPQALGAPATPPARPRLPHGQGPLSELRGGRCPPSALAKLAEPPEAEFSLGAAYALPETAGLQLPRPAIETSVPAGTLRVPARTAIEAPPALGPARLAGKDKDSPRPQSRDFVKIAWKHAQARGFARFASDDSAPAGPGSAAPAPARNSGLKGAGEDPSPGQPASRALPEAAADPRTASPAFPQAPAQQKPDGAPSLLSRAALGFFSAFSLVALVIEATALVVSQMTDPVNTSFLRLAGLVSASFGAYAVGSFVGGRWVDRLGVARSYRLVLAARTALWSLVAYLFYRGGGAVALHFMLPLFSLDYFVHSVGRIAERKLQVAWFPDSPVASSRFGTAREFIEWGAVFLAGLTGLAIAPLGFGVVLYPVPVVLAAATLMACRLKGLPQASLGKREDVRLGEGMRELLAAPTMWKPLLGMTLTNGVFFMLYYIVFTSFGSLVTRIAETAAQISGSFASLYGIGGALATGLLILKAWAIERAVARRAHGTDKAQAEREAYARSASRALVWAALGLLGAWLFVSQTPLGTMVWTLFPVSPAIVLIALTGTVAFIHMETIMMDRIPEDKKAAHGGSILGAVRAIIYASQIAGFLLCGTIFELLGREGFWLFGLLCTAIAGVYLWLARDLRRPSAR